MVKEPTETYRVVKNTTANTIAAIRGDAHIQWEQQTTGCRNAFAALKMHIKG